jgi:signal-transduction protein with cAMP-binding, CBS, and nucleotidyltransferase domain
VGAAQVECFFGMILVVQLIIRREWRPSIELQKRGPITGRILSNLGKELEMNTVRQILKAKSNHVWTISKHSTVFDALKLLAEKKIGSLVVIEDGQVAGIFTERDYARKVGLIHGISEEVCIEEVMTKELVTVDPNKSVRECMVIMTNNRIRHLPVMQEGKLVGMISVGDVVKDIVEELEFHVEQLTSYITGLR